jgi:hypothetical protein
MRKIAYPLLFISLFVLFFAGGGLLVTFIEYSVDQSVLQMILPGTAVLVAFILSLLCSQNILKRSSSYEDDDFAYVGRKKHFVFSLIFFISLVAMTLLLMNIAASFYTVPWPASGLHGVSSEVGKKAWLYHEKAPGFVKVNSWGQRDREHSIDRPAETYRMIFIGDSLLEDGSPVPLPYRTEDILKGMGKTSFEAINLGVSATEPDEYYYRLKRIGLPLRPDHCVLVFSASSDFIQEPSLLSYSGISSTYPRLSFLQLLGLKSLDLIISNERRPLLRGWFSAGGLLKHELKLQETFAKTVNDQETELTFLSFFPLAQQNQLKSVLYNSSAADRSRFYDMLRHPDDAKFRSWNLNIATNVAKGEAIPNFISAQYSFQWVKAAKELCRRRGIKFTLVIIPDGLTVDPRMSGQYSALADMKAYMKYNDDAVSRFVSHSLQEGMDVVDLRSLLQGKSGAYLNMDGHLSMYGVDLIAGNLAKKFSDDGISSVAKVH